MANLVIAFVASLTLNSFLGLSWWKSHDAYVRLEARNAEVQADADGCGEAVDLLDEKAKQRRVAAAGARATAAATAKTSEQRADYTLGLRPKFSDDVCASVQAMGDEWLKGREKK